MKKTILLLLVLLTLSCNIKEENRYNTTYWELKRKNAELDYLERLWRVRNDIDYEEKIKVMDSLIRNAVELSKKLNDE
jgi:hypothetical protein